MTLEKLQEYRKMFDDFFTIRNQKEEDDLFFFFSLHYAHDCANLGESSDKKEEWIFNVALKLTSGI